MSSVLGQQLIIAASAILLVILTVRLTRQGRLGFGTAVLWSSLAGIILVGAALVPVAERIGDALGVIPAALLAGATSVVLATILFLLSLRVSALERALQNVGEAAACAAIEPRLPPPRSEASTGTTLAVVPAFNEQHSIIEVVAGLLDEGLPVLVVNDGSTDDTAVLARTAGASVLNLPTNIGVGGALRAGARAAIDAGYTQIVQCDGDGQHPAAEVVRLLEFQEQHPVDLLIGSRFVGSSGRRNEPLVRRVAMIMLSRVATRASGSAVTDATSGLRVIRQPLLAGVAQHLPRHYLGDTFELTVSAGRAGFAIREERVVIRPRLHGISSASVASAFALTIRALLVVALRAHLPLNAPPTTTPGAH